MKSLTTWLKGLIAAIVSATANAVVLTISDPQHFNPGRAGWHDLGTVLIVSGIVGAALYLKQSPVPTYQNPANGPLSPSSIKKA